MIHLSCLSSGGIRVVTWLTTTPLGSGACFVQGNVHCRTNAFIGYFGAARSHKLANCRRVLHLDYMFGTWGAIQPCARRFWVLGVHKWSEGCGLCGPPDESKRTKPWTAHEQLFRPIWQYDISEVSS